MAQAAGMAHAAEILFNTVSIVFLSIIVLLVTVLVVLTR
jgi:hypothetical protein